MTTLADKVPASSTVQGCWQTIKSQLGNKVDAVYLQCYDGGGGNNPGD